MTPFQSNRFRSDARECAVPDVAASLATATAIILMMSPSNVTLVVFHGVQPVSSNAGECMCSHYVPDTFPAHCLLHC